MFVSLPASRDHVLLIELCQNTSYWAESFGILVPDQSIKSSEDKGQMRVAVEALRSSREPHLRVYPEQMLAMLLEPGSIEMGWRRSDLTRFAYSAGEIILSRPYGETWARSDGLHYLSVAISDAALRSACNGFSSAAELRSAPKLEDARVSALVAAVNAERIAGFPSGRLFLDSV